MPRLIKKGSTDITDYVFIQDSTDGSPETGVTITDLDLQYVRNGAAPSAKVDATALAATDSAHGDNQMIEIDATDQPGLYRVDWPDAAFASGVDQVICTVKGTGFQPAHKEYQLVDFDPTDTIRLGLTALPYAAADAAGGLPISDAGGLDLDTYLGRITGNVALASVVGALADAAAAGEVTEADTLMQYIKQLINILIGTAGIGTFPAEAAPANGVSLAEVIRAIHVDVTGLNGDAMRGTDSAATASKLTKYIQLLARSDVAIETDNATELTEINADGGSGGGDFSSQTDSGEAIRDHVGDGSNLTEAGGDGDHLTNIGTIDTCTYLTNAPTTGDLTATMKASVNTEVDNALNTAIPENPTVKSVNDMALRSGTSGSAYLTVNETTGAYSMKEVDDEATEETWGGGGAASGTITSSSGVTVRNPT
ncbi:MAG: hypothetical protein SVO01_00490 [Thermotogota bacterium]|nr:hypothetical protein [Thermotogota bacterium]